MSLVWKEQMVCHDEFDKDYVAYRAWVAYSGKVRVAQVRVWYGDENSANSQRGTVSSAKVTGRFSKDWRSGGYTWKGSYTPACANDQVPREWVEAKWAQFLNDAGLVQSFAQK